MFQMESLEARQFLSGSVHGAAKVKPVIPDVVGYFAGTSTETKPGDAVNTITLHISSESAKGALAGDFYEDGAAATASVVGKINVKGVMSIKILNAVGKAGITVVGDYSAESESFSGKYKAAGSKGVKPSSGTFSISVETAL